MLMDGEVRCMRGEIGNNAVVHEPILPVATPIVTLIGTHKGSGSVHSGQW